MGVGTLHTVDLLQLSLKKLNNLTSQKKWGIATCTKVIQSTILTRPAFGGTLLTGVC